MMRLVMFGHNDWWVWARQGFCTRNAALARELSGRETVAELLIVDSPRYRTHTHRPAESRRDELTTVAPGISAVRYGYPLPLPSTWRLGRRLNERLMATALTRRLGAARAAGEATVLWVADPRLVEAALAVPHDVFVFDAIDDWRQHPWAGPAAVSRGYDLAARHADVVFVVHPRLLEILQPRNHAEVLYNAVDARPWAAARPASELAGMPRPLAGYAGMIQRRMDAPLLAGAARLLPHAGFALVGRVSPANRRELGDLGPNVRLVGARPYHEVPALIAACDVCIVPHLRDALTATMDPLKLYEYLAAGKPVVSTVASPNPALADAVQIVAGTEAFAAGIAAAAEGDDEERRSRRRRAVAGETWRARADRVLEVLAGTLSASGGGRR
jgi:glycosyltransferase involved in cell wall biosynthesis